MSNKEFAIVMALARCAMCEPTDAIVHQVRRLAKLQKESGNQEQGIALESLLEKDTIYVGRIVQSQKHP